MISFVFLKRLLGHMDLDTREWFDGVLTAAARKVVKEPPEVRCDVKLMRDALYPIGDCRNPHGVDFANTPPQLVKSSSPRLQHRLVKSCNACRCVPGFRSSSFISTAYPLPSLPLETGQIVAGMRWRCRP